MKVWYHHFWNIFDEVSGLVIPGWFPHDELSFAQQGGILKLGDVASLDPFYNLEILLD